MPGLLCCWLPGTQSSWVAHLNALPPHDLAAIPTLPRNASCLPGTTRASTSAFFKIRPVKTSKKATCRLPSHHGRLNLQISDEGAAHSLAGSWQSCLLQWLWLLISTWRAVRASGITGLSCWGHLQWCAYYTACEAIKWRGNSTVLSHNSMIYVSTCLMVYEPYI